jgi:transposase-like protein
MITMNTMQQILMMYIHEGRSRREIARLTGIHRETVGKYVRQYEERRRQLLAEGNESVDSGTDRCSYYRPKIYSGHTSQTETDRRNRKENPSTSR